MALADNWQEGLSDIKWTRGKDTSDEYQTDPKTGLPLFYPDYGVRHPDDLQGSMAYAQWKYQDAFFRPIEDEIFNRLGDTENMEMQADRAGNIMGGQHQRMAQAQVRDMARMGVGETGRQKRARVGSNNLARTRDVSFAENSTRQQQEDFYKGLRGDMVGIGRGVAAGAQGLIGQAGAAKDARDAAYKASKQSYNSQMLGIGAAILGALKI